MITLFENILFGKGKKKSLIFHLFAGVYARLCIALVSNFALLFFYRFLFFFVEKRTKNYPTVFSSLRSNDAENPKQNKLALAVFFNFYFICHLALVLYFTTVYAQTVFCF